MDKEIIVGYAVIIVCLCFLIFLLYKAFIKGETELVKEQKQKEEKE